MYIQLVDSYSNIMNVYIGAPIDAVAADDNAFFLTHVCENRLQDYFYILMFA